MNRIRNLGIIFCLLLCSACSRKSFRPQLSIMPCKSELAAKITDHISQPRFARAAWGIKVVSLDTGTTLFEHNPEKCVTPASNVKLFTGALALSRLGPDFTVKTSLYATQKPDADGILKGDLIIYGRGDPTIGARLPDGGYATTVEQFVEKIKESGIRRIEGDLIGDESYFAMPPWGSGLEWKDLQEYYGAESSALSLYENAVDFMIKPAAREGEACVITTGLPTDYVTIVNQTKTAAAGTPASIRVYRPLAQNTVYVIGSLAIDAADYKRSLAIHNPPLFFVTMLKDALTKEGIAVSGKIRAVDAMARAAEPLDEQIVKIGYVESPMVKEIVRDMLKRSQNFYAQQLLLLVGVQSNEPYNDPRWLTTEERGLIEMGLFLNEIGIGKGEFFSEEGAGLSRKDLITPDAIIALLTYMNDHALAAIYRDSLPIAAVDGMLKARMNDTAAAGRVHAKTGTMRFVSALSGYATAVSGERLAFSIMLNNYFNPDRGTHVHDDIDLIPVWLAEMHK